MALKPYKDISGQTFGELTAISISHRKNHQTFWNCKYSCGKECKVSLNCLVRGHTKSCGHLKHKYNDMSKTKLYKVWKSMNERCYLPSAISYKNYGSRGIRVCDEWRNDFMQFYNWAIANGYSDDLSIDRINNDKGYCPSNCRWATRKVQMNNRSNSRNISYNGTTMTLKQWSEYFGFNYKYFHEVMSKNNWDIEKVLNMPYFKERLKCS